MPTSVMGRHSIDAEMNAEPFEYGETEIGFAVHFLKVKH